MCPTRDGITTEKILGSDPGKHGLRKFFWDPYECVSVPYLCGSLFLLGVVARIAAVKILHVEPKLVFAESELIAKSLAMHNLFADPYILPTGATAHHAPVYPFFLSLVFRSAGYGTAAFWAMTAMNSCFASLQYALLPVLGILTGWKRSALAAGILGAIVPWRIMKDIRWETSLTGLTLLFAVLFTTKAWNDTLQEADPLNRPRAPARDIVFFGLSWGVLLLVSPSALPAFFLVLLVFMTQRGWRGPALASAAICAITVLPWCVRDYLQLGGFVFIRDNFPLELQLSNNDLASPIMTENIQHEVPGNFFHRMHPYSSETEALLVRSKGELSYNRRKLQEALSWIAAHPGRFGKLTMQRIVDFWTLPSRGLPLKSLAFVPIEILAIWGIVILLRLNSPAGWVMLALWAGYPLVYYFVQTDSRYHYPLDWSTFFLACIALETVYAKLTRSGSRPALLASAGNAD